MDFLVAWVAFPLVLLALAGGWGMLVRAAASGRIAVALVPGSGMAALLVVSQALTLSTATVDLLLPVALAGGFAGGALAGREWVRRRGDRLSSALLPAALTGALALACYGAPVLFSGEATFAGYIKLDDSATWMALADRVAEDGRSAAGLPLSTYEAVLAANFDAGYPVAVFLPWEFASRVVAEDVAWTLAPYMSVFGALIALAAFELLRDLVRSTPLRVACVVLAAQPALLYGYALWGGIKEIATAALLLTLVALLATALREPGVRRLIPSAVVAAAVLAVLGVSGLAWLLPLLALTGVVLVRSGGLRVGARHAVVFMALVGALALIAYASGTDLAPRDTAFNSDDELGNLAGPLNLLQLLGIWPAGDFRFAPVSVPATGVLLLVLGVAAFMGVERAWRQRSWALPVLAFGLLSSCALIVALGSPWVDGKALATASPGVLIAAFAGGAGALENGRRVVGASLLAIVAGGVLWSNALGYGEAWLAPREQLAELEDIGERIGGQGPTLMTEFQPYGVRHFLREADPEGAAEFRRRYVALRDGSALQKGMTADLDDFQLAALLEYRTLVLRRSPSGSRPPLPFQLRWRGDSYEVWQRPAGGGRRPAHHIPLSDDVSPAGVPDCEQVLAAARRVPGGRMAAVARAEPVARALADGDHSGDWSSDGLRLTPTGAGEVAVETEVKHTGAYELWLGGSARGELELRLDDEPLATVRNELNTNGQYLSLGEAEIARGIHRVDLRYGGPDLAPGSGGDGFPLGPLVLVPVAEDLGPAIVPAAHARRLCGKPWDWIEALPAG